MFSSKFFASSFRQFKIWNYIFINKMLKSFFSKNIKKFSCKFIKCTKATRKKFWWKHLKPYTKNFFNYIEESKKVNENNRSRQFIYEKFINKNFFYRFNNYFLKKLFLKKKYCTYPPIYKFWKLSGNWVWNPYKLPKLLEFDAHYYNKHFLNKLIIKHFEYGPQLSVYNIDNLKYPVQLGYYIRNFDDLYNFFTYINPEVKEIGNRKKQIFKFTVFRDTIIGKLSHSDFIKWLRLSGQWIQKNPRYFGEPYDYIGEETTYENDENKLISYGINYGKNYKVKKLFFYKDLKFLKSKIFKKLKLVWYFCDFFLKEPTLFKKWIDKEEILEPKKYLILKNDYII